MSFFDWFKNQPSDSQPGQPSGEPPVVIFVTPGNEVEVPAAEARRSTIGQLFERYAEMLGIDPEQITRFTFEGQVVSAATSPTPGSVYRGAANSFVKGTHVISCNAGDHMGPVKG